MPQKKKKASCHFVRNGASPHVCSKSVEREKTEGRAFSSVEKSSFSDALGHNSGERKLYNLIT